MRRREPTDDERKLWQEHTRQDRVFSGRKKVAAPPPRPARPPAPKAPPVLKAARAAPKKPLADLRVGDVTQMDGSAARRFHKVARPDATLDLHGMTRDSAFVAFTAFVLHCREAGNRRLLVITGKGRLGVPGALREALPNWVNDPAVRSFILAYDVAGPRQGGEGAFTLLLKRCKRA